MTSVDLIAIVPDLYLLRFGIGNAYVWRGSDGLTLVDCGLPGSAPAIAAAIGQLGHAPGDVRRLILTHFHPDHAGACADVAAWGPVQVLAHRADAPFIRGDGQGPAPDLADWERPLFEQVSAQLADVAPPDVVRPDVRPSGVAASGARVDTELDDGAVIDLGGGTAVVISVPGHTPGSIALHLPASGILLTGDTIARAPDGRVMTGVFNVDRAGAAVSARRLAELDVEVAGFGHGDPLTAAAGSLRAALHQ